MWGVLSAVIICPELPEVKLVYSKTSIFKYAVLEKPEVGLTRNLKTIAESIAMITIRVFVTAKTNPRKITKRIF